MRFQEGGCPQGDFDSSISRREEVRVLGSGDWLIIFVSSRFDDQVQIIV